MLSAISSSPSVELTISRLRPRSVGEIIDQAFRLYRRNFLALLAIVAVVLVPVQIGIQVVSVLVAGTSSDYINAMMREITSGDYTSQSYNELLVTMSLYSLLAVVLAAIRTALLAFGQAGVTALVIDSYEDRPTGFGPAYRKTLKHLGPLVGVMLVLLIVQLGVSGQSGMSSMLQLFGYGWAACGSALGLGLFVLAIIYYVRWQVAVPALMSENVRAVAALRRSSALVQGFFWRTVGLLIVIALLNSVLSAGPTAFATAIVVAIIGKFDLTLVATVSGFLAVIGNLIFAPIELVAISLYYFDLRVRKEGYDIEAAIAQRYGVPASGA